MARACLQKLDKTVGLFNRDLGQFAVLVEYMEHISLGDSLGR